MKKTNIYLTILISVICNIFLCAIKTIVGVISNSQAMIADGIHSLEDVTSSIISLIGCKISSKENKKLYPLGISRIKYVFSLTVSVLMVMISVTMLKNVIANFFEDNSYVFSIYSLIVCVITIIVKLILYFYCKNIYKKTNNILIKSIMYDHRNDVFISTGVIISIVVTKYNLYILDYLVSIIISIIICNTGIKIYLESYNILTCKKQNVSNIKKYFKIKGYKNIDIISLGDSYSVIIRGNINNRNRINKIINEKKLQEYNVSHLYIKYM